MTAPTKPTAEQLAQVRELAGLATAMRDPLTALLDDYEARGAELERLRGLCERAATHLDSATQVILDFDPDMDDEADEERDFARELREAAAPATNEVKK